MDKTLLELWEQHKGPPVGIEAIIRGMGIELDKNADLDDKISGQIELLPNGKYRISTNKKDHYYRQRFTMAHELGHFIYHRDLISDGVDDTRAYRSEDVGKFYNVNILPRHETEANRFAASILMPRDSISSLWDQGITHTGALAKRLLVSTPALEIRLQGLGYQPTAANSPPTYVTQGN